MSDWTPGPQVRAIGVERVDAWVLGEACTLIDYGEVESLLQHLPCTPSIRQTVAQSPVQMPFVPYVMCLEELECPFSNILSKGELLHFG